MLPRPMEPPQNHNPRDPITPVFAGQHGVPDAYASIGIGEMYWIANLIWSAASPQQMKQADANTYCRNREGVLPSRAQYEELTIVFNN